MKRLFLTISLVAATYFADAQTYINARYTYDNAGNRINRQIVYTYNKRGAADTVISVNEPTVEQSIRKSTSVFTAVYPNPTYDNLYMDLTQLQTEHKISYSLTDLFGKVILQSETKSVLLQINLSNLASGIYILRIKSENFEAIHKINKLHQ